jgi:hypothetical protein
VRDGFQVGEEGELVEMTGDEKKTMKGEGKGEANAGEGEGQIFSLHPRALYSAFVRVQISVLTKTLAKAEGGQGGSFLPKLRPPSSFGNLPRPPYVD